MKKRFRQIFGDAFSLTMDLASQEEIYDRFVSGAAIKGTNMCILILSILIASIGLNMNSTAVIIGAMLISPLMSSLLAIAYGLASGDMKIVRQHFLGFLCQIGISLLTSTLYFSLTPISSSTSELLARTTPTIWDVMIAICGGLAGCIGLTRKEKSNVIPGVAIATALMPPLCTAGYGLATGQFSFFFGAFYLFTLNAYFICLSSVIVLLILRIPLKTVIDPQILSRIKKRAITTTVILLIPSIFFAVRMVESENITGFEDQAIVKLQELGNEASILFPQIDSISVGQGYSYEQGEVSYSNSIRVTVHEALSAEQEQALREWIPYRYPQIGHVDILIEPIRP